VAIANITCKAFRKNVSVINLTIMRENTYFFIEAVRAEDTKGAKMDGNRGACLSEGTSRKQACRSPATEGHKASL
jgi:hypothetical protein